MSDKSELYAAMAKAFPEIEGATKDSENPGFKSGGKAIKYADLSSVVEAIKPALVKHGLFFAQLTHEQSGGVCIETLVCHQGGEQMSFGKLFVPASKADAQGYGSALTYARRYSLMTAFGVCPEDDDGNASVAAGPPRITPDQELMLEDKMREVGVELAAILKWANIDKLPNMPADKFPAAMKKLNATKPKPDPIPPASNEFADLDDEVPY